MSDPLTIGSTPPAGTVRISSNFVKAESELAAPSGSTLTQRERGIWRAAITLANNICVQESDRINDEDGPLTAVHATAECAKRIRGWVEPGDTQLLEMLEEAGVQNEGGQP